MIVTGGGQTSRTDVTRAVIATMADGGVRRVVAQNSYGVGDSYDSMPFIVEHLVVSPILKQALADHAAQEAVLAAGGLDGTVLRPDGLPQGEGAGSVRLAAGDGSAGSLGRIARADVAAMLLSALDDAASIGRGFTIVAG